ncbi:MAG: response regulator transcription factor [Clostridia bacterium]|nr:response regulator transcription factor [Clostridia bacterium]
MIYSVEDEADIRDMILYALRQSGFEAQGFASALPFWAACDQKRPELVLLDLMLPGEGGLSILRRLRAQASTQDIPIILLTAKGAEIDRVHGLNEGADDYIAKPFSVLELVARVKALLRRAKPPEKAKQLTAQGLTLDVERHACTLDSDTIDLTLKEFDLLQFLMQHRGIAFSRERLLSAVWDAEYLGGTRTVDVHVQTLRSKLQSYGDWIRTVRGVGYKFQEGSE